MPRSLDDLLSTAEDEFLSSICKGPEAVATFYSFCLDLQNTIGDAIDQRLIDDTTLAAAHTTFSRIAILADQLVDLNKEMDTISVALQGDLNSIFSRLDITGQEQSGCVPSTSQGQELTSASLPPFIDVAYKWLLKNLGKPYPSKETKVAIARQTQRSVKEIDNWFINIRRRIGWNALRMRHFSNKRSLIVESATLFFAHASSPSSRDPGDESARLEFKVAHEFATIAALAENLYNGVRVTPNSIPDAENSELPKSSHRKRQRRRRGQTLSGDPALCYPSPEHSPERSLTLQRNGSHAAKRQRSSSFDSDQEFRSSKRSRNLSQSPSRDLLFSHLPSPAPTLRDSSSEVTAVSDNDLESVLPDCLKNVPTDSSNTRKRCLSDACPHEYGSTKRLRIDLRPHSRAANPSRLDPSLETTFDRLPRELDFSTDFPPPVTAISFDDLAPLEASIHQYNCSPSMSEVGLSPISKDLTSYEVDTTVAQAVCNLHGPSLNLESSVFSFADNTQVYPIDSYIDSFDYFSSSMCSDSDSPLMHQPAYQEPLPSIDLDWNTLLVPPFSCPLPLLSPTLYEPAVLRSHNADNSALIPNNAKMERVRLLREELLRLEADAPGIPS